jgi:hypothetical protein
MRTSVVSRWFMTYALVPENAIDAGPSPTR